MLCFLNVPYMKYATYGPTTPIEKIFAPTVVIPPYPNRNACNKRTLHTKTEVMDGPDMDPHNAFPNELDVHPLTLLKPKS